uniref:Uncharacterized protein n=1 Tax=Arundo donax TaxID=35708 RepID=A0A0A9B9N5_ARUDO
MKQLIPQGSCLSHSSNDFKHRCCFSICKICSPGFLH